MPWYYYSGQKPVAIPVGDGEVVSVRPHSKVEIKPSSANDVQIRSLSKMGTLRTCGRPPQAPELKKVEEGVVEPPKSAPGEPFKFNEFLVKEGETRVGRPSSEEVVAPADRFGGGEAEKVADVDGGDVQEETSQESDSRSDRRSKRRRSTP